MKFEIKDLIYIAALVAAGYFLFQMNMELSGANKSIKTLTTELTLQKKANFYAVDALQKKINSQVDLTQKLQGDIAKLQSSKRIIYIKSNEERTRINNIPSADSLASIISNRYR